MTHCWMLGRRSEYGIARGLSGRERAVLAAWSADSFPAMPTWLGMQQKIMLEWGAMVCSFMVMSAMSGLVVEADAMAWSTERESEKMI